MLISILGAPHGVEHDELDKPNAECSETFEDCSDDSRCDVGDEHAGDVVQENHKHVQDNESDENR